MLTACRRVQTTAKPRLAHVLTCVLLIRTVRTVVCVLIQWNLRMVNACAQMELNQIQMTHVLKVKLKKKLYNSVCVKVFFQLVNQTCAYRHRLLLSLKGYFK